MTTLPGDQRTAQTSHGANLMSYTDGIRQAGFVVRRDTGAVSMFMRHPNVTWTRSGTTMTCTWVGHEFVDGEEILVRDCSSSLALVSNLYYVVDATGADTFTITCLNAGDTSGHFCGYEVVDASAIANFRSGLQLAVQPNYPMYPIVTTGAANLAAFPGNTEYGLQYNDLHNVLGMGIDSQDRIWVGGAIHADPVTMARSAANSIKTWFAPYILGGTSYPFYYANGVGGTPSGTGANYHTYFNFHRLPNDDLIWLTDQQEAATSRGRDYLMARLIAGAGLTWEPVVTTWEFAQSTNVANTEYGSQDVVANRVYLDATVHEDKMHCRAIFRIWDGLEQGAKRAAYVWAYLADLTTWFNVEGDPATIPLTCPATPAARALLGCFFYEADTTHFISGAGRGVTVDTDGNPHIIMTIQEHDSVGNMGASTGYQDHHWDGSAWVISSLLGGAGGANGPTLYPVRDDLVMLTEGPRGALPRAARIVSQNASGTTFYAGATGSTYSAEADAVKLANDGILSFLIPDGDDPWVYEYGQHTTAVGAEELHPLGAETADGTITLDTGAGALVITTLMLVVTAFSGFTSVAWTLEDSTNNTTWFPQTGFTTTTGTEQQSITMVGHRRYIRLTWDVTGAGSITFLTTHSDPTP